MWTCTRCNRSFNNTNQQHYCGAKTINDFLIGKTESSLALFDHLMARFEEIGIVRLHTTKSMIVVANDSGFAYIIKLGKNFIDVVLPFKQAHEDNLCFRKIAFVPGSSDYNHHLRMMMIEDINEEVFEYMKKAYVNGKNI